MEETAGEPQRLLLTVADVGEWLQMSRAGIYRLIKRGELTPVYLDSWPRFLPADVEDLIYRHRGGGTT